MKGKEGKMGVVCGCVMIIIIYQKEKCNIFGDEKARLVQVDV